MPRLHQDRPLIDELRGPAPSPMVRAGAARQHTPYWHPGTPPELRAPFEELYGQPAHQVAATTRRGLR